MLQVPNILCLASRVSPSSAVLRQAVHLANSVGATLHAMSLRGEESDLDEALQKITSRSPGDKPLATRVEPFPENSEHAVGAIRQYVADNDVGLVVADAPANRGPVPPLADALLRHVVERLECPVFVVDGTGTPESIRRVLVATDLSDRSVETVKHAAELASGYDASLLLVHLLDTSPYVALTPVDRLSLGNTTLSEHRAKRRLQRLAREVRLPAVPIQTTLAFGEPADQICHLTNQEDVDLLVLSSHGVVRHSAQPLGPVVDRVLRRVTSPTFLVRAFGRSLLAAEDTNVTSTSNENG